MTAFVPSPAAVDTMAVSETAVPPINTVNYNLPSETIAINDQLIRNFFANQLEVTAIQEPTVTPVFAGFVVDGAGSFVRPQFELMRMGDGGQINGLIDNQLDITNVADTPTTRLVISRTINETLGISEPAPVITFSFTLQVPESAGLVEPVPSYTFTSSTVNTVFPTATSTLVVTCSIITNSVPVVASATLAAIAFIPGQGRAALTAASVLTVKATQSVQSTITAASSLVAIIAATNTHISLEESMRISENAPVPVFGPHNYTRPQLDVMGIGDAPQTLFNADPSHFVSNTFIQSNSDFVQTTFALFHGGVWVYPRVYIFTSGNWIQIQ